MKVLAVAEQGPLLASEQDALDLLGATYGTEIEVIAIPVSRLHPDFFRLRTRVAGMFLQKFLNYGLRVVIVGDITAALDASTAFRDFVAECNDRGQVRFVADALAMARLDRAFLPTDP